MSAKFIEDMILFTVILAVFLVLQCVAFAL